MTSTTTKPASIVGLWPNCLKRGRLIFSVKLSIATVILNQIPRNNPNSEKDSTVRSNCLIQVTWGTYAFRSMQEHTCTYHLHHVIIRYLSCKYGISYDLEDFGDIKTHGISFFIAQMYYLLWGCKSWWYYFLLDRMTELHKWKTYILEFLLLESSEITRRKLYNQTIHVPYIQTSMIAGIQPKNFLKPHVAW